MKHALFLLLLGFAGIHASSAQRSLQWDSTVINLGEICQNNGYLSLDIYFTNTSDTVLLIYRCNTTDGGGSLLSEYPRDPILPGARAKVKFIRHLAYPGPFSKSIWTRTNLGDAPVLNVRGNVVPPRLNYRIIADTAAQLVKYAGTAEYRIAFQNLDSFPFQVKLARKVYPDLDLFIYNDTGNEKEWYLSSSRVKQVEFNITLFNNYGDIGRSTRYIPFIVNEKDTVYVPLQVDYKEGPRDSIVIWNDGYRHSRLFFTNQKLYYVEMMEGSGIVYKCWTRDGAVFKNAVKKDFAEGLIISEYENGRKKK